MLDKFYKQLLEDLRKEMAYMSSEQRMEVKNYLFEYHCEMCGSEKPCFCHPNFDI